MAALETGLSGGLAAVVGVGLVIVGIAFAARML